MKQLAQLRLPGDQPVQIDYPSDVLEGGSFKFSSLADVINAALKYILPFAGLILLFMLIAGGFQLLTSGGDPESTAKGNKKIIFAIIGFLVIFIAFWLIQIIEHVLGLQVF